MYKDDLCVDMRRGCLSTDVLVQMISIQNLLTPFARELPNIEKLMFYGVDDPYWCSDNMVKGQSQTADLRKNGTHSITQPLFLKVESSLFQGKDKTKWI